MGALCCCFHAPDEQDNNGSNNSSSNFSLSPKWFFQMFVNKNRTRQMQAITSTNQQTTSSSSGVVLNNNLSDSSSRSRVQPEPIGQSDVRVNQRSIQGEKKLVSKDYSPRVENDEDVCPTCFEEYVEENPKIIMKCSHHYHLSCIYEWMERSQNCPVCGKLMLFDESR